MPYLTTLPDDAAMLDVLRLSPKAAAPLVQLHEELMRGNSPLTEGQRELLAAYVSGLNSCAYCHGVHAATAEAFGIPAALLNNLLADLDSAEVEDRFKQILRFVRKLTLEPASVTSQDAAGVLSAGWDDRALHDAVMICGLFSFMNRVVLGLGLRADEEYALQAAARLSSEGYAALLPHLGDG